MIRGPKVPLPYLHGPHCHDIYTDTFKPKYCSVWFEKMGTVTPALSRYLLPGSLELGVDCDGIEVEGSGFQTASK